MDFMMGDERLLSYPGANEALHRKWGWMVY